MAAGPLTPQQLNPGGVRVNTLNDIRLMHRTLDKVVAWTTRWEMEFNVNKFEVIHIGKRFLEFQY